MPRISWPYKILDDKSNSDMEIILREDDNKQMVGRF